MRTMPMITDDRTHVHKHRKLTTKTWITFSENIKIYTIWGEFVLRKRGTGRLIRQDVSKKIEDGSRPSPKSHRISQYAEVIHQNNEEVQQILQNSKVSVLRKQQRYWRSRLHHSENHKVFVKYVHPDDIRVGHHQMQKSSVRSVIVI